MRKPTAPRPPEAAPPDPQPPETPSQEEKTTALVARPHAAGKLAIFSRHDRDISGSEPRPHASVVSTGFTDRLADKRRALWALWRRRLLAIASGLLLVAVLVWVLAFSPLLALRTAKITITGSDGTVDVQQVQQVLAPHAGTSLLRLDLAQMSQQVSQALVHVRSAQVTRTWPHGLQVALTMRVAVAVYKTDAGYEVLDGDGVVLETDLQPPDDLAVIADAGDSAASAATPLTATAVNAVAQAVGALDVLTRAQVVSGTASASGQVTLTLASGASVIWGDNSELALKAEVLKVLLSTQANTYDVSSPHNPTTA